MIQGITITKKEYRRLKQQSTAYRQLAKRLYEATLKDSVADVVEDFRKTNRYSSAFLRDLENGLQKSSYNSKKSGSK